MQKNQPFLSQIEPSRKLSEKILSAIAHEKQRRARIHFVVFDFSCVTSAVAIIPAFQYALQEFSRTGFYEYFSLLFSDGGLLLSYWKEFSLSLIESLPLLGLTVLLVTIFALLKSFTLAAKNMRVAFLRSQRI